MAPQIGFPGLAPRSRAHLCFTIVEGSNRRREEGDVSRGFRVSRATDWQGPIGFFVASPFPTWRRTHFPSTLNSCQESRTGSFDYLCIPHHSCCNGNLEPISTPTPVIPAATGIQSPFPHPTQCVPAGMFQLGRQPVRPPRLGWHSRPGT